jgi:hypothetical protein
MEVVMVVGEQPAQARSDGIPVTDTVRHREVRVTVNGLDVTLSEHKVTGLQVKEAAIAAEVPIQLDFVLSEVRPSGEQKIISDDRKITVEDGDEFWAIPGDDNS